VHSNRLLTCKWFTYSVTIFTLLS